MPYSVASRIASLRAQPVSVTDDRHARLGGYYLRQNHKLIQRHVESISLSLDHTARWQLRIDIELPTDRETRCNGQGDRCLFLFPLVYLSKSDGRLGFTISDESGGETPVPTRQECDRISGIAAAEAGNWLINAMRESPPTLAPEELTRILRGIPAASPFAAAQIFDRLRGGLALHGRSRSRYLRGSAPPLPKRSSEHVSPGIGAAWEEEGLADVLRLLVEHSLVWVPIWGSPGERRVFTVSQDISLERRPFLRWSFGETESKQGSDEDTEGREAGKRPSNSVLTMGGKTYGRRAYRISFSVLGERIGQPLAWMPIEYDFPTIHTRRCGSYHFELTCPAGLTPRALKVATGGPIDESSDHPEGTPVAARRPSPAIPSAPGQDGDSRGEPLGRTKLTPSIAHHYLPGSRFTGDLWFRVTVGVAEGAMPVLWWLAGALTAALLWTFAATHPALQESEKEIAAGVLLVVPALVAALAIGGETAPVTRLIGGARILLLVTGLSAVVAASVLLGAAPFGLQASWTICAIATTVVTIPLATSWVLSNSNVWRQLKKMKKARWQYAALRLGIGMAALPIIALQYMGNAEIARAAIAVYLLTIVVGMTALVNNRVAMDIGRNRRYVAVSMLTASITCTVLACIELKGAVDDPTGLQTWAERAALVILFLSPFAGPLLDWRTRRYGPEQDEIHVSPQVGRELVAKERVLELNELLDRRWKVELQTDPSKGVT